MERIPEPDAQVVIQAMRRTISAGSTGCGFAAAHVGSGMGRIEWGAWAGRRPAARTAGELSDFFEYAAEHGCAGLAIFPEMREPDELAELLLALPAHPRWRLERVAMRRRPRDGVNLLVAWRTAFDDETSVLGFAPLGSMPVTRRAPYFALAAWGGGHDNLLDLRENVEPGRVGFPDMPPPTLKGHDAMWKTTRATVRKMLALPSEGAADPAISVTLPATFAAQFAGVPGPAP